jgi:hypothetical protein
LEYSEDTMKNENAAQTEKVGKEERHQDLREERRRDPRFATSQPVVLTILGPKIKAVTEGCILNISDRGLRLRIAQPVAAGTLIKVEAREARMLGEVVRCVAIDGAYHVGVHLFQSLTGAFDLSRLNNRLLLEDLLLDVREPGLVRRAMDNQRAVNQLTRRKSA